jgi:hypothetical protein
MGAKIVEKQRHLGFVWDLGGGKRLDFTKFRKL